MKKTIFNIVVIIYVIIAIFTTVCLLSYNDYKVTEFGDKALIIMDSNNSEYNYKKGDLIITNKSSIKAAKEGEEVFFYDSDGVKIGTIKELKDFGEAGVNIIIEGKKIVQDDIAGTSNDIKVIHGIGGILGLLESKWGFLFIIIFPSLLAFLYEIYVLINEITNKKGNKE